MANVIHVHEVDKRLVVRPAEAAEMLGCSRLLVYRMVRDGRLRSVKDGNRRLIRVSDIEAYLKSLEPAGA